MITHGNPSSSAFARSETPRRSSDAGSERPAEKPAEPDAGQSTEPGTASGADSPGESEAVADAVATAELVRQLAEGRVAAGAITTEQRRRCVDHLTLEGFSAAEIAELTGVNERTVRRDREALRSDGALTPTRALGDELLGELQKHTHAAVARLARLSN